jgi:hypothetical protein
MIQKLLPWGDALRLGALKQIVPSSALALALCVASATLLGNAAGNSAFQENFPAPPADRTLIYWRTAKDAALTVLPIEAATTNLRPENVAGSDKMGRVELRGENAQTAIADSEPHFFLFVPDTPGVHPPLLVRLTRKRGGRQAAAMVQRGLRGLAIVSEDIVKPHYRVLRREGGSIYMEVWGRQPLEAGEYGFISSDLARISTFRIVR